MLQTCSHGSAPLGLATRHAVCMCVFMAQGLAFGLEQSEHQREHTHIYPQHVAVGCAYLLLRSDSTGGCVL